MKPVYLNPSPSSFPLAELKEEPHVQLSLSPVQQTASSLSADDHPTFFNTTFTTQDQRVGAKPEESKPHDHKEASSSSSLQSAVDIHSTANDHNLSFSRKVDAYETASDAKGSSLKWMLSTMRLMKKMKNSNCSTRAADNEPAANHKSQYAMHDSDETGSLCKTSNDSIRVCSDCHTSTTPLWRSGPRGPKSLCNACGIRKRKARRAMEAEANGAANATSMKIKVQKNKDKKKQRTSPINVQYEKHDHHLKLTSDYNNSPAGRRRHHQIQTQKKLCLKEFCLSLSKNSALQHVFPQDVEDAAILLMAISCGLVHS